MKLLRYVKRGFSALGIDVRRLNGLPEYSMLGLKRLNIQTVLDVGANIGQFATLARRSFPAARIIAFEPIPAAAEILRATAAADKQLEIVECAIGEREGTAEMNLHREHSPSSSLMATTQRAHELYPFTSSQERISVPIRRLDSVIRDYSNIVRPEILVKIDVQGYEGHVIRGGRETLGNSRACIIEVNCETLYEGQPDFAEVVAYLSDLGMRYSGNLHQVLGPTGRLSYFDAVFVRPD